MPKFNLTFCQRGECYWSGEIEADNEDEAKEKFLEEVDLSVENAYFKSRDCAWV